MELCRRHLRIVSLEDGVAGAFICWRPSQLVEYCPGEVTGRKHQRRQEHFGEKPQASAHGAVHHGCAEIGRAERRGCGGRLHTCLLCPCVLTCIYVRARVCAYACVCVHMHNSYRDWVGQSCGSSYWLVYEWYASALEGNSGCLWEVQLLQITGTRDVWCQPKWMLGWGLLILVRWSWWQSCQLAALDLGPFLDLDFHPSPSFCEMPGLSLSLF